MNTNKIAIPDEIISQK